MTPKISIIVGLYNVASFLKEKQLNCIFNQTCSDWELILVDDGSTDETPVLCDRFAKQDKRVKVVHKENGGLGSARNAGMEVATGEYLWFYDVDDEAELNVLESCIQEMDARQTDMMIFGFWAITPSMNTVDEIHFTEKEIRGQKQLRQCYLDDLLLILHGNGFAWNKVYRRNFIEQHRLRYENQRIQQDEVFNLKVYQKVNSIYLCNRLFYHYYIYNTGNTRSKFIPDRLEAYKSVIEKFQSMKILWNISDERFDSYIYRRSLENILTCLSFNLFHEKCPWTDMKKKEYIVYALNDSLSKETITYLKNKKMLGYELRTFFSLCKTQNLFMIKLFLATMNSLRKIKRMMH